MTADELQDGDLPPYKQTLITIIYNLSEDTGYLLPIRRGIFFKFRPREREISKFGLPKASTLRGPLCVPWCSGCYLARSCRCFGDLGSPCDALVVGPSWQSPSWSSWAAVVAEIISCRTPRDCELRLARGRDMATEVAVLVFESAACLRHFTGTITELLSQPQTVWSPARCRSLSDATVDRLYLKGSVRRGFQL